MLEYLLKIAAGVSALIVLGSQGGFVGKLVAGYGSVVGVFIQMAEWPGKLIYLGNVVQDYNTLTVAAFNQKYGGQAVHSLMQSLNEGVAYLESVYHNLAGQPIATLLAALVAFSTFYAVARILRFIRQKGQGSWLIRKERSLGKRMFRLQGNDVAY